MVEDSIISLGGNEEVGRGYTMPVERTDELVPLVELS